MNNNLSPRINLLERNVLIDGGMNIWPQGTSRSVANNTSLFGAVLFKCNNSASNITVTNSQQPAIGTNKLRFSNQISKTAAGTLASGTAINLEYGIEGQDLERIYGNNFSIIFIVKSSVASTRSVSIRNSTGTHSYVKQYTIAAANTPQLVVLPFAALSTCPGTINRDNTLGILVDFSVITGSNGSTSTLDQWVSGGFLSGTGEDSTWLTGTNHDFSIAGAMIIPGDWTGLTLATYDFVRATANTQTELAATQRYYETLSAPGITVSNPGASPQTIRATWQYKVTKRVTPTVTVGTGAIDNVSDGAASSFSNNVPAAGTYTAANWSADARF